MSGLRWLLVVALGCWAAVSSAAESLPDTTPLTREGDVAADMVAGMHRYLDRELAACAEKRKALWKPDYTSLEAYRRSLVSHRERLRHLLGAADRRLADKDLEYVSTTRAGSLVGETNRFVVHQVRWQVFDGVDAEGLL